MMIPDLSVSAYVYLTVSIVIPIVILGCITPLYVVVDKIRSQGKTSVFFDRWLYNGSSEIGICLLSLTLLISVATSTKPSMHYLYEQPTLKVHSLELFGLSGAVICIGILTGVVFFRYGLKKMVRDFAKICLPRLSLP